MPSVIGSPLQRLRCGQGKAGHRFKGRASVECGLFDDRFGERRGQASLAAGYRMSEARWNDLRELQEVRRRVQAPLP